MIRSATGALQMTKVLYAGQQGAAERLGVRINPAKSSGAALVLS